MNTEILLPYVCLIGGICVVVLGVVIRKKLEVSKSWPKTTGLIVKSSIESGFARVGGSYNYVVRPEVAYEYKVDEIKYTSSQLALIEYNSANEKLARRKAGKFLPGQQVDVHYNPRKPKFAVLSVGDPTGGKLPHGIIIFGVMLAISGAIWIWVSQH